MKIEWTKKEIEINTNALSLSQYFSCQTYNKENGNKWCLECTLEEIKKGERKQNDE